MQAAQTDADIGAFAELIDAARVAARRHYPAYPVIDDNRRIVGIVRGWPLFERQAAELSGQSGRMAGVNIGGRAATPKRQRLARQHLCRAHVPRDLGLAIAGFGPPALRVEPRLVREVR